MLNPQVFSVLRIQRAGCDYEQWLFWTTCACERRQGVGSSSELQQSSSKQRKASMLIFTRLPWDNNLFWICSEERFLGMFINKQLCFIQNWIWISFPDFLCNPPRTIPAHPNNLELYISKPACNGIVVS